MKNLKTFEQFLNEGKIAQSIIDGYKDLVADFVSHDLQWVTLKFSDKHNAELAQKKIEKMGVKSSTISKDTHVTNESPWELTFRNMY